MLNNEYFVIGFDLEYIYWQNQTKDRSGYEDGGGLMFYVYFCLTVKSNIHLYTSSIH